MENRKFSKLIIFVFVLSVLGVAGIVFEGVSYESSDNYIYLAIEVALTIFLIWWSLYLRKQAIAKDLKGSKLAISSCILLSIVFLAETIGMFVLMNYTDELISFANSKTPHFFENNLSLLKENSTDELKRILSYSKETEETQKQISEVGNIKECVQEREDGYTIQYGSYTDVDKLLVGLRGFYSTRCYGEQKAFDFVATTKYENGRWLIDNYLLNANIGKDFSIDKKE